MPLTERVREILRSMEREKSGPFGKIKQYQFRAVWHEAKGAIGLGTDMELVPHCLRHTCASRLVRGGVDIRRVQMWLGHQTLQMTMRYPSRRTISTCAFRSWSAPSQASRPSRRREAPANSKERRCQRVVIENRYSSDG